MKFTTRDESSQGAARDSPGESRPEGRDQIEMVKRRHLIGAGSADGHGDKRDQPQRSENHTRRIR